MQALLVIDMEQGFLNAERSERNNPNAEKNILKLMDYFRETKQTIIHIQHLSTDPHSAFFTEEGYQFMEGFEPHPGEKVFQKHVNSAFIGMNLEGYLHEEGICRLVITGLTLPHCVSTTTRMAGNLGFETTLISDATATYALRDIMGNWLDAEALHQSHLAALNEEFAKVMSCEEFLRVIDKKENEID